MKWYVRDLDAILDEVHPSANSDYLKVKNFESLLRTLGSNVER